MMMAGTTGVLLEPSQIIINNYESLKLALQKMFTKILRKYPR